MTTGSTIARFTITLSKSVAEPVQVAWNTKDGTAKAGIDYAAASGTALFSPGETNKDVDVLVYGRAVGTEDRNFFLEMTPPPNAILGKSIGECIIYLDTAGNTAVIQVIVPTGPQGAKGDSAYQSWLNLGNTGTEQDFIDSLSPPVEEIAAEVAPILDISSSPLTAEGTETLSKPDTMTGKRLARRVAYVGAAKVATVVLADGDNLITHADLSGDAVDFNSISLYPRILRGTVVISPEWSVEPGDKILIKSAVAGDVLHVCQYDVISERAVKNVVDPLVSAALAPVGSQAFEALRRSHAEAGHNVVGTFRAGFTIVNANDIGIDEATGKGFTGPAGPVAAWTDPASGGFVDCSRKYGPRRFASASDMINAAGIGVGDLCEISSYTGSSGFGGGTWVAADSSLVAANGVTQLSSANPAVTLVLQHSGAVNICQVGAVRGGDVTNIVNVLNNDQSVHTVYGARLSFACSNTVFLKKTFIGRGASFDFAGAPSKSDSFSAYNFPEYSEISDFKVVNSKRVALIGNGAGAQIERVRAFDSVKQGINWAGDDWEISRCLVNGVTQEFGILNGGNSKRFKISKCNVFNVTGAGSFELGYQFSDCEIAGCFASDGFAGVQVFANTPGVGSHSAMRNVRITGFTSRNMSNAHIHIKNDFVDTLTVNDVTIENVAIQGGGEATGIRVTNIALLRLVGGSIKNVGGYAMEILSGVSETEINDVDFDGITGSIPFIFTASDNVTVNNSYFKNGHAIIGADSGNAFENILLSGCRTKNISTPHINISELSIKYWNGNDFVTTFSTANQLLGSYPAGYKRYYTNPQPSGSIGLVCTKAGVYGSTAVFKLFGAISA